MPEPRSVRIAGLLYACCLLSGAAALMYEVVWNRELLAVFGSTTYATAAVLAAFLGGMALGAALVARTAGRIRAPLSLYAGVELTVAGYALLFGWLLRAVAAPYGRLWEGLGATPGVLLSGPLAVGAPLLLVPTVALGATLPLLGAGLERVAGTAGSRDAGRLYGFNTLGAVVGALGAGFVFLPRLGMSGATAVALALNLAAAGVAVAANRMARAASREERVAPLPPSVWASPKGWAPGSEVGRTWLLPALLLLSSAAALGYEVVWTRILVLVVGSSTYAFSLTAGVFISGLALGSLWMARRVDRLRAPGQVLAHLLIAVAWSSVAGLLLVGRLPGLFLHGFAWFGPSPVLWLLRILLSALIMLPPTFFLGAVFPVAVELAGGREGKLGRPMGQVYAWMAGGNVVGILLASTVFIPRAGLQSSLALLAVLSLAAGGLALWLHPLRLRTRLGTVGAAALGCLVLWGLGPRWDPVVMTSGVYKEAPIYLQLAGSPEGLQRILNAYRLVFYQEGVQSVVSVVERPTLGRRRYLALAVDGKVDASTGSDMSTQVLSGHLPLFIHPEPREVLVVGLASGVTLGSVARHPVERVDVVEIEPAMEEAARAFDAFNHGALSDRRVHLVFDDGRHFLGVTGRRYDVIISEPSNPWMSGPARLFTREFFALARSRLAPGGVMAQWVPLYDLAPEHLRALVRTFQAVFPYALAFRVSAGDLLVLGSEAPLRLAPRRFTALWRRPQIRADLARLEVRSVPELLATWVGGEREFHRLAGAGPLNTDRNGLIEFGAPRILYENTLEENTALVNGVAEAADILGYLDPGGGRGEAPARLLASLAYSVAEEGDGRRARAWARAAMALGESADAGYVLGRLERRAGDSSAARGHWEQALRTGPHPPSLLALARLELEREAMEPARAFLSRVPAEARSDEFHYLSGVAYLLAGDLEPALGALSRVDAAPGSALDLLAAHLRARVAARLGDTDRKAAENRQVREGLRTMRYALEREEGQEEVDRLLSDVESLLPLLLDASEVREMYDQLRTALLDPMAAYYRGVSLLWSGHPEEAAGAFQAALTAPGERYPGSMARFFLGMAYLELGRSDPAVLHLREFHRARTADGSADDWAVEEARRLAWGGTLVRPVTASQRGS